jgi:TP901 family phage tail tape measure protein
MARKTAELALIVSVSSELDKLQRDLDGTRKALGRVGGGTRNLEKVGQTASAAMLGIGVAAAVGVGMAVNESIQFESAFAGVEKTIDGTAAEMEVLREGIRDMAKVMPATREEIAGVAEAAGQLGVKKDAILDFSKVMVDLGETTDMSAEEAAIALARLSNITQMTEDDYDNLGSAIVDLGNKGASTEREIVDMALRIAGAGHQVGMSEADILGLSSALASVGIEAEAGGSAISKVMVEIAMAVADGGEELESFAQVAGMSSEEFAKAFEEDAAGAIVAFVSGLGRVSEEGGNVFGVLEQLGITEVRMRDMLLRAAGAGDLMAESLVTANTAWTENNALTDEAAKRYETTEAQIQMLRNNVSDLALELGDELLPMINDLVDGLREGVEWFAELDDETQRSIVQTGLWAVALGLGVVAVSKVITATKTLTGAYKELMALELASKLTSWSTALTGIEGVLGLGLTGAAIGSAATLGYMTGELINQNEVVAEWQRNLGEAIATNEELQQHILGSDGAFFAWNVTAWETAEVSDEVAQNWRNLGISLDETGQITEEGIAELKLINAEMRDGSTATAEYTQALAELESAQLGLENAEVAVERGKLRLEDAQANYNAVLAEYPAGSREARDAALDLREAELYLEGAQIRVRDATDEVNASLSAFPRPQSGLANDWIAYYESIGDAAGAAAARANAANGALRGGRAKSSTGGYNIPVYGTGTLATYPHLAVVGDVDEVIVPLNDSTRSRELAAIAVEGTGLSSGTVINVNVDARGATDPALVKAMAMAGVNQAAQAAGLRVAGGFHS